MDSRGRAGDALIAVLLCTATAAYLALLPRSLNPSDEAIHLYDAKRILEGAVPYRDFFNFITPGFMYVTAVLFWIFGASIETARLSTAVLHGITADVVYLTCRRLDVRRQLAWPPALAYVLVCQPAWPIASQHWLSTFLCVLLLFVCAGKERAGPRWPFVPGFVLGLLVCVQQQRGLFMMAGTLAWLVADRMIAWRYRPGLPFRSFAGAAVWLIAGTLVVVVPVCGALIAAAGFEKVWAALVVFPLFNYRPAMQSAWGHTNRWIAWQGSFTYPRALRYLPAILPVNVLQLIALLRSRQSEVEARRLGLLIFFCAASVASIAYYPDFIHIAFIAPAFFVAVAVAVEWSVRRVALSVRLVKVALSVAGAAFLLFSGVRLQQNLERLRDAYPHSRTTAFGRVGFANPREAELYDTVRELMQGVPSRYLYCYPIVSHLYLLLDVANPTPYGFFFSAFNGPEQTRDVLRHLAEKQPPYIVFLPSFVPADDPVAVWIREHYTPTGGEGVGQAIYRVRRSDE
jgi:hypothetical protein